LANPFPALKTSLSHRNEIIPQLTKNPSLDKIDLELVSGNGQIIKSGKITPAMFEQMRTGKLTVRAPPDADNALGLVKFIFPNQHQVYIHGTPESDAKYYSEARAVSHGCIHAQRPAELAAWVLRNNPGWDLQRVEEAMREGRNNLQVNLASPIPVLIIYQTALVTENGDVHFFDDIYCTIKRSRGNWPKATHIPNRSRGRSVAP
jgi:L,D-transpeptidase YcbB